MAAHIRLPGRALKTKSEMKKENHTSDSIKKGSEKGSLLKGDVNVIRERLFHMVSVGVIDEPVNQMYDIVSTALLILNLAATIAATFDTLNLKYGELFVAIEAVSVAFFAIDYILRLVTANCLYPELNEGASVLRYMTSLAGVIDLSSFLPYYLPWVFPKGAAVFRMFRVARIMRLFRINAYYDSLNVITEVLSSKKQQLLSSVFIIIVMMMASSLSMYSVEHEAQPQVFENAFSGIWWAASTLLTVGYGDIYPVTIMGKVLGILIAFLGVGLVAIPTGIISAGFVEQYSKYKQIGEYGTEEDVRFIRVRLAGSDQWVGRKIHETALPKGMIIAAVQRGGETIVPRGDVELKENDRLMIGAQGVRGERNGNFKLQEIRLKSHHPWCGKKIKELDISRRSYIVMVRRKNKVIVPGGDTVLQENDLVIMYTSAMTEEKEQEKA